MKESLNTREQILFDAACTDRLNPDTRAELQEILRNSSECRSRYLDYASMHADLLGLVRAVRVRERFNESLGVTSASGVGVENPKLISYRLPERLSRGWVGVAAVALAATVLMVITLRTSDRPEAVVTASAETQPRWPDLVAKINRVERPGWDPGARRYAQADLVAAGEQITIKSGIVEIEFRQGAVVVLEGPAELIVEDPNAATLVHGKLAAVAPPWATGFRIDTPGLDVIDHGTEFAVSVTRGVADPIVNVVVTEGEVEVLTDKQQAGGRRLTAGQGVRSMGASVEYGDDPEARKLTEQLPDSDGQNNAEVVGDRWSDWTPGVEGEPCRAGPWRYFTNSEHAFGNPSNYAELVWDSATNSYRPQNYDQNLRLSRYVRAHRDGGHPGKGSHQVDNQVDRYCITGFDIPEDGAYRIEAGWLERLWAKRWDKDRVLDVAVHVNDEPLLFHEYCNRNCFMTFRSVLGDLKAGDTVYVGVGPSGLDYNDRFRWGFHVVREKPQLTSLLNAPAATD